MEREQCIRAIFRSLGVGRSYQGYEYVVYGLQLVLEDETRLKYITKSLYPDIAKKYHTSWGCVERNIRTVVDVVWREENEACLLEICGGRKIEKPKNGCFFELMSEYVKRCCAADGAKRRPKNRKMEQAFCKRIGQAPEEDGTNYPDGIGDCRCPETGRWCEEVECLRRRIVDLSLERETDE